MYGRTRFVNRLATDAHCAPSNSAMVRVGPECKKVCKRSTCIVRGAGDGRGTLWFTRFASGTADYLATAQNAPGRRTFWPSSRTKATARYLLGLLQSLLRE